MSDGMKKKRLPTKAVKIPDVRITSSWEPQMLEMFRASVKSMGIQEPILVAWDGKDYWLIDGQHRLEEAKMNNQAWIEAVVVETDMKGVHLRNLVLNRLRGKTKASEMVQVVKSLREDHGTGVEEIIQKTGLRRDYLEQLMSIGEADPEIWGALDREEIGVGQAFQLSRIPEEGQPVKLLAQVKMYSIGVKDLKGIVDDALQIIEDRKNRPQQPQTPAIKRLKAIPCHVCEENYPVNRMRGMNVCVVCYGIIYDLKQRRLQDLQARGEAAAIAAQNVHHDGADEAEHEAEAAPHPAPGAPGPSATAEGPP